MDEVDPAILDSEGSLLLLLSGLIEKDQVAPVVEVPGDRVKRVALMTTEYEGRVVKTSSLLVGRGAKTVSSGTSVADCS